MRICKHPALAAALVALSQASPLQAQGWGEWLSAISPERIVQQGLQTAIMMARTQFDLQYGSIDVDILSSRVSVNEIVAWPLPDWDENGDCTVEIDRLTLQGAPLDDPNRIRMKAQMLGAWVAAACVPPDGRAPLSMAGLEDIYVPRLTLDLDYDVARAGADAHAFAEIEGVANVDLTAAFSYLWFDGRDNMDNPDPVIFLSSATLALENRGLWEQMQAMAPPPLSDPAQAPAMIDGMLRQALAGINAQAAPEGSAPAPLSDAQEALIASAAETWTLFLANPQRLVLETGIEPGSDVFVDVILYEDDPLALFDDLQPRFSLAPSASRMAIDAALLQTALNDPGALGADDRLAVGRALVSGDGAPRNRSAGMTVLQGLAEAGDGDAAMAMSQALAALSPDQAYQWALVAGAAGNRTAPAQLDRLERQLSLAQVLQLQSQQIPNTPLPAAALESISSLRAEAAARLSGNGQSRSYALAALWAMLGAAAGDAESSDILAQIDRIVATAPTDDQQAWAAVESEASSVATRVWIDQNLPAKLAP